MLGNSVVMPTGAWGLFTFGISWLLIENPLWLERGPKFPMNSIGTGNLQPDFWVSTSRNIMMQIKKVLCAFIRHGCRNLFHIPTTPSLAFSQQTKSRLLRRKGSYCIACEKSTFNSWHLTVKDPPFLSHIPLHCCELQWSSLAMWNSIELLLLPCALKPYRLVALVSQIIKFLMCVDRSHIVGEHLSRRAAVFLSPSAWSWWRHHLPASANPFSSGQSREHYENHVLWILHCL